VKVRKVQNLLTAGGEGGWGGVEAGKRRKVRSEELPIPSERGKGWSKGGGGNCRGGRHCVSQNHRGQFRAKKKKEREKEKAAGEYFSGVPSYVSE